MVCVCVCVCACVYEISNFQRMGNMTGDCTLHIMVGAI